LHDPLASISAKYNQPLPPHLSAKVRDSATVSLIMFAVFVAIFAS